MDNLMVLQSLEISLIPSYQPNAGNYTTNITFRNKERETISLILPPEFTHKILALVGDSLVGKAKEVANNLVVQLIESTEVARIEEKK